MAVLHSPGEAVDWTPPDQVDAPEAERIGYRIRVPSRYDMVAWRRAVAKAGGRQHGPRTLLQALRRGVERLTDPGAARDFLLSAVDEQRARYDAMEASLAPGAADGFLEALQAVVEGDAALTAVSGQVADGDDVYGAMLADNAVYAEIRGLEAARLFLDGWSGLAVPFTRHPRDGVPPALLSAIPDAHILGIGTRVAELSGPTETERKNSPSPSPGPSDRTPSPTASTQPPTNR